MRILARVGKTALELAHDFIAQHVLDFLGVFMHVIGGDLRFVRQIEFPQTMVAHNGTSALPATWYGVQYCRGYPSAPLAIATAGTSFHFAKSETVPGAPM